MNPLKLLIVNFPPPYHSASITPSRARCSAGPRSRHLLVQTSPTPTSSSTATSPPAARSPRRKGRRRRILHPLQELQHARLAYRLHGRQPETGRRPGRLKSYFDYGTFTPLQVASIAALDGPQELVHEICDIMKPPRRTSRRPQQARLARRQAQGHHVRLGQNPRPFRPPRLPRLLQDPPHRRQAAVAPA